MSTGSNKEGDKEEVKTLILEFLGLAIGCLVRWWKGASRKESKQ